MAEYKIENFKVDEVADIALVMREAFNSVDQNWDEAGSISYIKSHFGSSFNKVARNGSKIIGIIIADKKDNHLFIDAIGVLPDFMGQGVAKQLWSAALEYGKAENLDSIKMITDPKSVDYQWYLKLGFNDTGWVEMEKKI